jgi:arginase family enzyme
VSLQACHLNLDSAWPEDQLSLPTIEALEWGPQLRFSAPPRLVEKFFREVETRLAPVIVYGSGDFHHLSALWVRRAKSAEVVVSFDNHPDWDIRPPKWCCGSWVNRALELPHIKKVSVWGCGNFECWWPGRLFGNTRAERAGQLEVHPWADDRSAEERRRRGAVVRENWREKFQRFATEMAGRAVYITVDLDCLRAEDAATNWENGRYTSDDVAWALETLQQSTKIVAGDICGAYSPPSYARWKQRFAAGMDHPKIPRRDPGEATATNLATLRKLLPLLTGGNEHHSAADNERANR